MTKPPKEKMPLTKAAIKRLNDWISDHKNVKRGKFKFITYEKLEQNS